MIAPQFGHSSASHSSSYPHSGQRAVRNPVAYHLGSNHKGIAPHRSGSPRAAAALDRPDLGRDRLVEHDEVRGGDVEALLPDGRAHEDVVVSSLEPLDRLDLLLLLAPAILPAGRPPAP